MLAMLKKNHYIIFTNFVMIMTLALLSGCPLLTGPATTTTTTVSPGKVATPSFSPPAGTYSSSQTIAITCGTSGAVIRYTLDGNAPTETSSVYTSSLRIDSTTTVRARAYKAGMLQSDEASGFYTIGSSTFGQYQFSRVSSEVKDPSYVNVLFYLGKVGTTEAVTGLTESDFEVAEDGAAIATLESALRIRGITTQIPNVMYTVLMLDTSASVGNENLAQVKNAAKALVARMVANQRVAVYEFSGSPRMVKDFTDNKTELDAAIDSIALGFNATDLYNSIITGLGRWTDSTTTGGISTGFLVVFTDGKDTTGTVSLADVLATRGDKRVVCVAAGSGIDAGVLNQIGNAGYFGGTFERLAEFFGTIQDSIANYMKNFYWLSFMSPKRGDRTRSLDVVLKRNTYTGSGSSINVDFNSRYFYSVMPGLYVNDSRSLPTGVSTLEFRPGASIDLTLHSYFQDHDPEYVITFNDKASEFSSEVLSVSPIETKVRVTAVPEILYGGTILVRDVANSLEKLVHISGFSVVYDGNRNTGGYAPVDPKGYLTGASVMVAGNVGGLARTGYWFMGWNTAADGLGTNWTVGSSFTMGSTNVVLYAKWASTYTVTYNGNGNTGGTVPVDTVRYLTGTSVTVAENVGGLVRTGYWFTGWNTAADGSGTNRTAGIIFMMGSSDVMLYAQWKPSLEMVNVPGGSFQMGTLSGGNSDEQPVHLVNLTGFQMSKYEVTQEQYREGTGSSPSYFSGTNLPVENVSWYDAVEFCNRLSERDGYQKVYAITGRTPASGYPITGATVAMDMTRTGYRLPTEAEWEYAARGGDGSPGNYTYAGSNDINVVAWYGGNSGSRTHEVGTKAANGLGLHDMTGNVSEWVWDWYGGYPSGEQTDSLGASSGDRRGFRGGNGWGGSMYLGPYGCRSALRSSGGPENWGFFLGFRVVRRP